MKKLVIEYTTPKEEAIDTLKFLGIIFGILALIIIGLFSVLSGHFIVLDWIFPQESSGMTVQAPSPAHGFDYTAIMISPIHTICDFWNCYDTKQTVKDGKIILESITTKTKLELQYYYQTHSGTYLPSSTGCGEDVCFEWNGDVLYLAIRPLSDNVFIDTTGMKGVNERIYGAEFFDINNNHLSDWVVPVDISGFNNEKTLKENPLNFRIQVIDKEPLASQKSQNDTKEMQN